MDKNYKMKKVPSNIFVSTAISYDKVIDFDSIESMYDSVFDWNLGIQFWEYDIEEDDINTLKKIVSKKLSLSKQEIAEFDWNWATRKVMCDTYKYKYESELFDELFEHTENVFSDLRYHFETSKGTDSVHFSEGSYIRVGMTKKEFEEKFWEDNKNYYETKEEFFDEADDIFETYIFDEVVSKYDLEYFDYYGSRVCIYNEWEKEIFESLDWELSELLGKRKKHYEQIKNYIKNKVALIYRTDFSFTELTKKPK